ADSPLHGTGNVSPPGARGTAHRATTPCTGRETSALQGRGEPRTEQQPPALDGKRQPSRGAGNRAQLSNTQHWTGYVTLSGARGTAHKATTPRPPRETPPAQGREEPRTPPTTDGAPPPPGAKPHPPSRRQSHRAERQHHVVPPEPERVVQRSDPPVHRQLPRLPPHDIRVRGRLGVDVLHVDRRRSRPVVQREH